MTVLTENPGRPYGSRPEDDEAVLTKVRHGGRLPWTDRLPADEEPPKLRASEKPRRTIPGGPGPDDELPCFAVNPDLFDDEVVTDEHHELCDTCPFRAWCLATATANDEWGIWAATSRDERKAKQQRRREAA